MRQSLENGKIFVHLNTDAPPFGQSYHWIDIPNQNICAPPKFRPKQIPFEMQTFASSPKTKINDLSNIKFESRLNKDNVEDETEEELEDSESDFFQQSVRAAQE